VDDRQSGLAREHHLKIEGRIVHLELLQQKHFISVAFQDEAAV